MRKVIGQSAQTNIAYRTARQALSVAGMKLIPLFLAHASSHASGPVDPMTRQQETLEVSLPQNASDMNAITQALHPSGAQKELECAWGHSGRQSPRYERHTLRQRSTAWHRPRPNMAATKWNVHLLRGAQGVPRETSHPNQPCLS